MKFKKCYMSLCFMLCTMSLFAQHSHTEFCIDFRVNKTVVETSYANNALRLQEIVSFLQELRNDSTLHIVEVSFCGAASPEGSDQLNRKLAQGRMATLERLVRQEVELPDSLITYNDRHIPWDYLKRQIQDSELSQKEELLHILNETPQLVKYNRSNNHIDSRIGKIQQLDGGRTWQQLKTQYFARMRNACAVIVTYRKEPQPVEVPEVLPKPTVEPVLEAVTDTIPVQPVLAEPQDWVRQLHVKTNVVGLGLAIANVAVEVDVAKHWSVALPVYFSAWDYFKPTVKFRTLAVQPEVRYWLLPENGGWFAGAHAGAAYFNLAVGGDYRFQDRDQRSPALGGGVSVGYRTHLSANKRWNLEFALGAGCYSVYCDKYYNVENGKKISARHQTYIGLDNAAINLSYSFHLNKRK